MKYALFLLWFVVIINTLRSRQNGHKLADDIFELIFLYENNCISIKMSLIFVPKRPFNNELALFQTTTWHRTGDKPLSEPMMAKPSI